MKNMLKLSNYLFGWFFHKYERFILAISIFISTILLLIGNLNNRDMYNHIAIEFRTYDLVVDYSGAGFVFLLGLIILFVSLFIQMNSFYTNGKGMYSIFTLPMKRNQVFMAFFISAIASIMLYFLVWLVVVVVLYFPISSMYEKAAAKAVLYISEQVTLRDLDASITNGFFLAFQRSTFLSTCFPSSWVQCLALWSGMFLATVSVVFAGLYNEFIFIRVVLFIGVLGGFAVSFYQAWILFGNYFFYSGKTLMPTSVFLSIGAVLVGATLLYVALYKLKRRKDI
ncbi:hypothetical protein [Anaerotignum sp.]|uniref:hypothetical protein n=1 Tax=Anaerotignum sp. TaxID=2039241 RepID=UPI0028AD7A72|nr:hypothetical protein [Anaerotignum sp.]